MLVACPAGVCAAGIKAVWELAQEVDRVCGHGRIRMLDIGGGLSVDYSTDEPPKVHTQVYARPSTWSQSCAAVHQLVAQISVGVEMVFGTWHRSGKTQCTRCDRASPLCHMSQQHCCCFLVCALLCASAGDGFPGAGSTACHSSP